MAVTLPSSVPTTNVDNGTVDTPKDARANIKTCFDALNTLLGQINAIGIMQIGDGLENEAQAAATKDKLRIKLNGAGITSGFDRSATGIKIADGGVVPIMLSGGVTTPAASKYYGSNGAAAIGFHDLPSGKIAQVINTRNSTYSTQTTGTTIPRDNTTPLSTEGVQFFSQAITLASSGNKVMLLGHVVVGASGALTYTLALFRGTTCIGAWDAYSGGAERAQIDFLTFDTPGTVGPHTYSVRVGTNGGGTIYFNGGTAQLYNGSEYSDFTLLEVA